MRSGLLQNERTPLRRGLRSCVLILILASAGWGALDAANAKAVQGGPALLRGLRSITTNKEGWLRVAGGSIGENEWVVERLPERGNVCIEVSIRVPMDIEPYGGGQCSRPVVRRGILLVRVLPKKGGSPKMTVVAGAFNKRIQRVEMEGFDGRISTLPLRRRSEVGPRPGGFSYLALAVRGPLCARRIMSTYQGTVAASWNLQGFTTTINTSTPVKNRQFCGPGG